MRSWWWIRKFNFHHPTWNAALVVDDNHVRAVFGDIEVHKGLNLLPKATGFDDSLQIQRHQGCDPSFIAIVDGLRIP